MSSPLSLSLYLSPKTVVTFFKKLRKRTQTLLLYFVVDICLKIFLYLQYYFLHRLMNKETNGDAVNNNVEESLTQMKRRLKNKMDLVFDAYLAPESDFPACDSPIWVFGRSYSIHYGIRNC